MIPCFPGYDALNCGYDKNFFSRWAWVRGDFVAGFWGGGMWISLKCVDGFKSGALNAVADWVLFCFRKNGEFFCCVIQFAICELRIKNYICICGNIMGCALKT